MEIVGFWTPEYLESRRETLKLFQSQKIIIAINEKSLREGAKIPENFLIYKTTIKLDLLLQILEKFRSENKALDKAAL